MSGKIPTLIIGGTGYVAGELLRLVAGHPQLTLAAVSSGSQAGSPVATAFPHLAPVLGDLIFTDPAGVSEALPSDGRVAIFAAAPHVVSASAVASALDEVTKRGAIATVVDVSSDFRFRNPADFEAVYKSPHGAPDLLPDFLCALPEHVEGTPAAHVGHPGCFASAMLLGSVPLLKLDLVEPVIYATGVTGSTGAGRTPIPTTHHPERHSNLFAYNPLGHRHAPEVVKICEHLTGIAPELNFVPHSGPFARGIHMTLQARLKKPAGADGLREALAEFYAGREFVRVVDGMPRVKNVAGSNYAEIGVAADGRTAVVCVVVDNLIKGAAGGAVQWMNRLQGWPEGTGLTAPAPGWI